MVKNYFDGSIDLKNCNNEVLCWQLNLLIKVVNSLSVVSIGLSLKNSQSVTFRAVQMIAKLLTDMFFSPSSTERKKLCDKPDR